jgi:UPF0716 family protein affecting phage T7 exclusion
VGKIKAILKKIAGGAKAAGTWTLRRGPLVASVLTGAALVFPQAAGVLRLAAGAVATQTGGAADQELVEAIGVAINGAVLLIGAIRKAISLSKPLLNPPADAAPGK